MAASCENHGRKKCGIWKAAFPEILVSIWREILEIGENLYHFQHKKLYEI